MTPAQGGRLGKNALLFAPAVVVPAFLSLGAVFFFTRIFNANEYGRYSLVQAVVAIVIALVSGWLTQAVVRYMPRAQAENTEGRFLGQLNVLIFSEVVIILVAGMLWWPQAQVRIPGFIRFYIPALALVATNTMFVVFSSAFHSRMQSGTYSLYAVLTSVLRWSLAVALVLLVTRDISHLITAWAVACAVVSTAMWLRLMRTVPNARVFAFDRDVTRRFFSYGVPVMAWGLVVKLLDGADRFVIAMYHGSTPVGLYSPNYAIVVALTSFVATPLMMASEPLVFSAWERGARDDIREVITRYSRYFLLVATPVAVLLSVLSLRLAQVALGPEFHAGHRVVPFVAGGMLLWNLGMYGHNALKLGERTAYILGLGLLCAALNLGLNFLWVPAHDIDGAAWATFVAFATYPVLAFFAVRKTIPWRIPPLSILRIAVAGAVAAVCAHFIDMSLVSTGAAVQLVIAGTGGALAYGLTLMLIRELRPGELDLLRSVFLRHWKP